MRRPTRALAALLAGVVALAGCGLDGNSDPQAIAPENLPPGLLDPNPSSTTTVPESTTSVSINVYLLVSEGDRDRLTSVEREVEDATTPGDRLAALFSPPTPTESRRGLTSTIPADTVLLEAPIDPDSREVQVNLSEEFLGNQGSELAKAFAQIVWSLTELETIRQVRFFIEGEEINALDAEGVEKQGPVTRSDYASLAPR